jgi:hypothetical protein
MHGSPPCTHPVNRSQGALPMNTSAFAFTRPFAIATSASSGIGLEEHR